MTVVELEIVLLVVVPVFPLAASLILVRHWGTDSTSLHERTLLALRDWLVASDVALVALNRIADWQWPTTLVLLMLATGLLLISLPSAYWVWLYWRGRFR